MQAKKAFLLQPEWIAAVLITVAATVLHFIHWSHVGGLWRDEVNTVNLAGRHSLAEMQKDSFPVLMPLTLRAWIITGLGNSDSMVRFYGLLVGLGILAALWISNWKICQAPPLFSLVLLGLNSTLFFVADSLRPYGLGTLLAVALTASSFRFVQQPSNSRALWFALFAILAVQTLYHNVVLVAGLCLGAWAVCWRRKDLRAAIQTLFVAAIAAMSLLPYAHGLASFGTGSQVLRTGVNLPRFFASYHDTLGYPRSGYIYIWAFLYVAIVFCAVAGRKSVPLTPADGPEPPKNDLSLFAAIVLTVLAVGFPIFFWRSQMPMESWYLLPLMACAVVCFDVVLSFRKVLLRAALLVFVVVTVSFSIPSTARISKFHFSSMDIYAARLSGQVTPKDYIIVVPWFLGITFDHYFKGVTPWDTLPPLSDHSVHRFDLVQSQMENTNAIAPVLRQIAKTLQSGHRVFILADTGWMWVPKPGTIAPAALPPAPLKDSGWSDRPYTRVWAAQVASFLSDHSTEFGQLKRLSPERFVAEDMNAFVASGWQTNSSAH